MPSRAADEPEDRELDGPHTPSWYARRVIRALALAAMLSLAALAGAVVALAAFIAGWMM